MQLNINCHPIAYSKDELNYVGDDLLELGVTTVRHPLWRGYERSYKDFEKVLKKRGIELLHTLDTRSFTDSQNKRHDYTRGIQYWEGQFPKTRKQILNEVDQPNSESSGHVSIDTYTKALLQALGVIQDPHKTIPSGLVHIDEGYIFPILDTLHCVTDSLALHIYGPADEHNLDLERFMGLGLTVFVTEFAYQSPAFYSALQSAGVAESYLYCYSQRQHPDLYLVDADGNRTPAFDEFKEWNAQD